MDSPIPEIALPEDDGLLLISEAATPAAVPPPAADTTVTDPLADEALMGAFADLTYPDDAALGATQTSTKLTRNNTMVASNISLRQLFGRGFAAVLGAEAVDKAHDPALMDTDAILHDIFGEQTSFVHDAFTSASASGYHKYQQAVQDAKLADCMSELDEFFGPHAEYVKQESGVSIRPNVTMSAAYPAPLPAPKTEDKTTALFNSTLLLTMPTVHPNRQILHFDTIPYNPMTSRPKESTDRKTYTPQNIMMWTYEPKTKQYLSNTRVIQWSDGTTTLHVGAEMYDIETFTDGALSFLGERRHMYRCDKAYSAIIETVAVDNHVTVRSRSDRLNSIDFVTASRTAKNLNENVAVSLGLPLASLPTFSSDGVKGGRKTVEEEYVETERAALKKLILELERKGNPMSLAEQMRRDAQILNDVFTLGKEIDTLVAKQHERKRQEDAEKEAARAEREAAQAAKVGSKRIRLPGGIAGGEKRSRAERKTDREPVTTYEEIQAQEEAAAEEIAIQDISGDKWRSALSNELELVRSSCIDVAVKETISNTIDVLAMLSKEAAVSEVRKLVGEVEHDSAAEDQLRQFELFLERLSTEE